MTFTFIKQIKKRVFFLALIGVVVLLPIVMLLIMKMAWKMTPGFSLNLAYVDKTDDSEERQAHQAFYWVLHNQQIKKADGELYDKTTDYYGVFPDANGGHRFNDFDQFTAEELDALSQELDVLMLADTYGVYADQPETAGAGLLYGGLSLNDIALFRNMKQAGKTVIAEFNVLQAPTSRVNRRKFQEEAGIQWTGWSGKYFASLDRDSELLPGWAIASYKQNYEKDWDSRGAGIILVHEDGRIVVLSEQDDLETAKPQIKTFAYGINQLELPHLQEFPYWFDVMEYDDSMNHAISAYQLELTEQGKMQLSQAGIPDRFPAVLMQQEQDFSFYYLCGDFSSEPVSMSTSRFKGVHHFGSILKGRKGIFGENEFFYRFYLPFMRNVLKQHNQVES
ncbi:hypothetical protein [uncultured Sunxiuqinia sp.]|uniref:hypothetical protein n=1 Tax=uncultured Sunxiuqinia sp. TaxID=1573825 RepID=UPI00261E7B10|nr:hypothetical protein [uncultured Sunxiuqinia sp.]